MPSPSSSEPGPSSRADRSETPRGVELSANEVKLHYGSAALTGLFVLAAFYTIYLTRSLLLPIVFAVLLSYLLSPIVRRLQRWWIPASLGAGIVIFGMLGGLFLLARAVSEPLSVLVAELPENMEVLRVKLIVPLQEVMNVVSEAGKQLEEMTSDNDGVRVVMEEQDVQDYLLNTTPIFFGAILTTVILLYFILAYKSVLFLRFIEITPRLADKKRAVDIFRNIEYSVSRYLLTIFLINSLLGLCVGGILAVLGFPNPVLWGAIVGVLNFAPYVGAFVGVSALAITAIVAYDSLAHALIFPAIYAVLNALEGNFITPLVLGRSFTINPIAIVLGLLFWSWLWGIPGALLAVPILVVFKVTCSHLPHLRHLDELLDHRSRSRRAD